MRTAACASLLLVLVLLEVGGAWKPKKSVAGKSIYFLVTDRFARSGKDAENYEYCDLATSPDPRVGNGGAFCNGTLQGIIDKIDYIKGMGFDCIWITPVVKAMDYTGYFAENFFDIEPHLGDKETLKRLSTLLHQNGMCLIVDIVANHVRPVVVQSDNSPTAVKEYIGVDTIYPFNDTSYFHTHGRPPTMSFKDYVLGTVTQAGSSQGSDASLAQQVKAGFVHCGPVDNPNLTQCNCFPGNMGKPCPGYNPQIQVEGWFGQLADLNQSVPFVKEMLLEYVRYLVKEYDVDAFRLDTAIYMDKDFLTELQHAADVDIFGETTVNNISYHASFQDGVLTGLLNFPTFYTVPSSFCQYHFGGHMGDYRSQGFFTPQLPNLQKLGEVTRFQSEGGYANLDLLANFVDNHDEFARITYYCNHDASRIKNALAWAMLARGTPVIYYGTEQGLTGHQRNVQERAAMQQAGEENKGQAFVRESLWHTRHNTSTWQYAFIRQLNDIRKRYKLQTGRQSIYMDGQEKLIFSRTPEGAGPEEEVWIFLNNKQNWSKNTPIMFCQAPEDGAWMDALTGERAIFTERPGGCFIAKDAEPKILINLHKDVPMYKQLEKMTSVENTGGFLLGIIGLLLTNVITCGLLWMYRRKAFEAGDGSQDESDEDRLFSKS